LTESDSIYWKEAGWDGIYFSAPADWEVGQIDRHYLLLESHAGAVLEIKWGPIRGRFSTASQLRRLIDFAGKHVKKSPLPESWQQALDRYQSEGFCWEHAGRAGRGAVLFCPTCRNAILIQFLQEDLETQNPDAVRILASLRDHAVDGRQLWAVFDICAWIPAELRLLRYRFEPGRFELVFTGAKTTVTLYRWAPAAALLKNTDLGQFVKSALSFDGAIPSPISMGEYPAVEWEIGSPGSIRQRLHARVCVKPYFRRFRFWHLPDKNRILGLGIESRRPIDSDLFEKIGADYGSL